MLIDVEGLFLDLHTVLLCAPCRAQNSATALEPYSHYANCENCGFPDATVRLSEGE